MQDYFVVFAAIIGVAFVVNLSVMRRGRGRILRMHWYREGKSVKHTGKESNDYVTLHLAVEWVVFCAIAFYFSLRYADLVFVRKDAFHLSTLIALVVVGCCTLIILKRGIRSRKNAKAAATPYGYMDVMTDQIQLDDYLTGWQTMVTIAAISFMAVYADNAMVMAVILLFLYAALGFYQVKGTTLGVEKIKSLYRYEQPDNLIYAYEALAHAKAGTADGKNAVIAIKKAYAYAYYGEREKAEATLQAIDWQQVPRGVAYLQKNARAAIHFLFAAYHVDGFILTKEAMEDLRQVILKGDSLYFEAGHKTYDEALHMQQAYVWMGELLTVSEWDRQGRASKALTDLEEMFNSLKQRNVTDSLLMAYVLSLAYDKAGVVDKRESMRLFVKENAPHCGAFQYT